MAQIEASARTEAQNASSEAVAAERQRIEQIDSIAASIPDQQLVHDAKYGDNPDDWLTPFLDAVKARNA